MIRTDYFKNKKVTVVGFARSGLACANLLYGLGARVSITDKNDTESARLRLTQLKSKDIKVELGAHTREFVTDIDLLVVSPGVSDAALPVVWAREKNIPVISEVEVASVLCAGTIIAVTGTSGKTTVTTLIGRMIEASGRRVIVCGNIGTPFSQEVEKIGAQDFVALEISSFQLQKIAEFKPKIAVMLNFGRNHLDRHSDIQEYFDAKKRIFENQDESDYLVLNDDDPLIKNLSGQAKSKAVYFKKDHSFNPNQAAVLAVASILGIEKECVLKVFKDFKGIEHRMEQVAEINKINFINDSKATTVSSAVWALEAINSPVILIAGGRDKGNDYADLLDLARKKVKAAILIGEAKDKMKAALSKSIAVSEADSLEDAVKFAFSKAAPGDCVLLSPMCASFDMFANYEERGRVFKKTVHDLMKAGHGS